MGNLGTLAFAFGVAILYDRDVRRTKQRELDQQYLSTEIPDMSMDLTAPYADNPHDDLVMFPADMSEAEFQDIIDEMSDTIDDVPEEPIMELQHVSTQHFRIFELDGDRIIAPSWQWGRIQKDAQKYNHLLMDMKMEAKGGATVVTLLNEETGTAHTGVSVCSLGEHFDKRRGRVKAYGRAVSAATRNLRVVSPQEETRIGRVALELSDPLNKGAMLPLNN